MQNNSPKILIISSCSLSMGPAAIAGQYYDALRNKGLQVDLLLKNPEPNHPEYLSVYKEGEELSFLQKIRRKIRNLFHGLPKQEKNYHFFYRKEIYPPVSSNLVVKKIKKPYDLVLIFFWQGMLSFDSIERIYDKLHCQIQFMGVDYSQMSGGCHFTGDCQRYKVGCGCCPAFQSNNKNDFTAWNVQFRKRVYEKVKPIVYGNLYMMDFYRESYLLKNARCEINPSAIIDTNVFKPLDEKKLRLKYRIPEEKRIIISFACQVLSDERKGMKYLIEAFEILYNRKLVDCNEILIAMAGKEYEQVEGRIPFDTMGLGYIPMNSLPELYSMSKLFVCPSVYDAGPMMVNQSLCCGTPVVGFDMGSVKQLVKDQGTGVCVPLRDTEALAKGIESVAKMSEKDYSEMSTQCRKVGMDNCSYESQANLILKTYQKYI